MFWDAVAGIYPIFETIYNGGVNRALCELTAAYIDSGDAVLDCACGTGMLTKAAAPRCRRIIATDFSAGMLRAAKKHCADCRNLSFRQADITRLPIKDSCFDKVIAGNVLHILDDPLAALRELSRVCKEDGLLLLPTYMNKTASGSEGPLISILSKAGADFKRQFNFQSYEQFLRDAGFADITISRIIGRVPCALAAVRNNKPFSGVQGGST